MGQQVIVKLRGIQYDESGSGPVEVISCGERYEKNGKVYVVYEEVAQDELVRNTIKISDDEIDIIKRGSRGTHLVFREGQNSVTYYSTPFGELEIGIVTSSLSVIRTGGKMEIRILYDLNINNSHISECIVDMSIEDKDVA